MQCGDDFLTDKFGGEAGRLLGVNMVGGPMGGRRTFSKSASKLSACLFANSVATASRRSESRKFTYSKSMRLRSSSVGLGPEISKLRFAGNRSRYSHRPPSGDRQSASHNPPSMHCVRYFRRYFAPAPRILQNPEEHLVRTNEGLATRSRRQGQPARQWSRNAFRLGCFLK